VCHKFCASDKEWRGFKGRDRDLATEKGYRMVHEQTPSVKQSAGATKKKRQSDVQKLKTNIW